MPSLPGCPGTERFWQQLFSDRLSPEQREHFERHLQTCPACQQRLDQAPECDEVRRLGRQVGDPTHAAADPTLSLFLERLATVKPPEKTSPAGPVDLYLLHPAERPELLGPGGPAARIVKQFWLWLALAGLVLLIGIGLSQVLPFPNAPPEQRHAELLNLDFRGGRMPVEPLVLYGPDAELVSKPEEEGWRITVPADRPKTQPVGLVTTAPVQGNFTLTTSYDILRGDQPTTGDGVGFQLYVFLETPTRDAFGFYRLARPGQGEVFLIVRATDRDGQRRRVGEVFPARSKTGQLRVTRRGTFFTFWAKEEGEAAFRQLVIYEMGPADLQSIRLAAYTGNANYAVDLRIRDLQVSAEGMAADQAINPGTSPKPRYRAWLLVGGIVALLVLFTSLGVWLSVRQKRREERLAGVTFGNSPNASDTAAAFLSLSCSGCGSPLKVQAVLAGKKVKCPRCGTAVLVPGAQASPTIRPAKSQ
jgi:hypothetical protein